MAVEKIAEQEIVWNSIIIFKFQKRKKIAEKNGNYQSLLNGGGCTPPIGKRPIYFYFLSFEGPPLIIIELDWPIKFNYYKCCRWTGSRRKDYSQEAHTIVVKGKEDYP